MGCQGKYEAAEDVQQQALTGLKEALGPLYSITITSMQLERSPFYWGKYSESQKLILDALRAEILGENHHIEYPPTSLECFRVRARTPRLRNCTNGG
jgi:hypothetical protein